MCRHECGHRHSVGHSAQSSVCAPRGRISAGPVTLEDVTRRRMSCALGAPRSALVSAQPVAQPSDCRRTCEEGTMSRVLGVHEIELVPGTDPEAFEQAAAEVVSSAQPNGWRTLVLKGGARAAVRQVPDDLRDRQSGTARSALPGGGTCRTRGERAVRPGPTPSRPPRWSGWRPSS